LRGSSSLFEPEGTPNAAHTRDGRFETRENYSRLFSAPRMSIRRIGGHIGSTRRMSHFITLCALKDGGAIHMSLLLCICLLIIPAMLSVVVLATTHFYTIYRSLTGSSQQQFEPAIK
jgi:hypothetical protein